MSARRPCGSFTSHGRDPSIVVARKARRRPPTHGREAIYRMPPEEHTLFAARVAKSYVDSGITSAVGAAAGKPRLDVVIRNAINEGHIPGPRYLANGQEIATLGGLGDTSPPHIEHP